MPDIGDEVGAEELLATLLGCPPEMLDVSLDQLRTLAVVHTAGTAQRAARVLGREQSSVQKQIDNLNRAATRLVGLPLLAPTAGLLAQFLGRWYGPDCRGKLDVIADIDSLNYGLNLLNAELLHGCMLTTERVADAVLEGRLPGRGLRKIDLADDYEPALEIVTGIFARKAERDRYAADHPLNLLWDAFARVSPASSVPPALPG